MKSFIIALFVVFFVVKESESQCITKRTDWGQFGSFFVDPLCDIWCRMRQCGKGECKENPRTANQAYCVCEKCYKDENGNAVYPNSDDNQYQNQDYPNIYRGQSSYDRGNNDYN